MADALEQDRVDVRANLEMVRARITTACERAGRDPAEVTLIAVCKSQPLARVEAALKAGERVFGENYVQEAQGRWGELRPRFPDVELHMIGALQSNKALDAVRLFDVIQTLDRPKLVRELAKALEREGVQRRLFVEVNTGEEPQKAGVLPSDLPAFLRECREEVGLYPEGLMAIPPADDDTGLHASLLRKLVHEHGLAGISIGMSADYELAIRFGATHVRVGSSIFGARPPR